MTVAGAVEEVLMPRISDTMSEGAVGRWLKSEGETVIKGEPIAEIETDKATLELEAPADGTLLRQAIPEGGAAPPGALLALVGPAGSPLPDPVVPPGSRLSDPPTTSEAVITHREHSVSGTSAATPLMPSVADPRGRVRATPLARRLAGGAGLELRLLSPGSGPEGRILRQDVERALRSGSPQAVAVDDVIAPSRLQLTIARRMAIAKREIPHYYVDATVDVTELRALRARARAAESRLDVSETAYVMRAVALALRAFPRVNAVWTDGGLRSRSLINVGLAVALEDEGLLVPVVRQADEKAIPELAAEIASLSCRAREGGLATGDVGEASLTISNLGMFGIDSFHAIINPSESGILAIGAAREGACAHGGSVVIRELMNVSLSADHRVYSGATAAAFLGHVRLLLESPLRLL